MKNASIGTVLFVCSLMLNAFLVGFLVSNHCMPQHGLKRVDRMEQAAEHLPPAYRAKVEAILAGNHGKMDDHMTSMGNNMDRITAILTAPKFDAAKLKTVHQDIEKSDNVMKNSMLETTTAIAKILPDAERIKFFKDSAPDHPLGPPPHGDGHGPDRDNRP